MRDTVGTTTTKGRTVLRSFASSLALVLGAAFIAATFINVSCFNNNERALFLDMVYGKAHQPFVQRVLVPSAVRLASLTVPLAARERLAQYAATYPWIRAEFERHGWSLEHFTEYAILCILLFGSAAGFAFSMRALLDTLVAGPPAFRETVPLFALAGLLPFFPFNYIYDLTELFLFTLGLLLMVRRVWIWYLLVFVLACLNKETSVLLAFVFAIHFGSSRRLPRSRYLGLLGCQLGTFVVLKALLWAAFRDNPGQAVEVYLWPHVKQLLRARPLPEALELIVFPTLMFHNWHEKPLFLRHAVWIFIPLFVSFVPFGYMGEIRVFYEVYPICFLLIAFSTARVLGVAVTAEKGRIHLDI